MPAMNRLSPLIVRRPAAPRALAFAAPFMPALSAAEAPALRDDLRLFVTALVGGLIFFGTLIG
jgi:hypothetical protein